MATTNSKTTTKKTTTKKVQSPLRIGAQVLIRTVTMYDIGRIVALTPTEILLADASWVASTGRLGASLRTGTLDEVEHSPVPISVARGAIVDAFEWCHNLPSQDK